MSRYVLLVLLPALATGGERLVESVLPSLAYGSSCWSSIELRNLGDRIVAVDVEGHRASGALTPLDGRVSMNIQLHPGESSIVRLQIEDNTYGAWAKVRERVPDPRLTPVIAASAVVECVAANELRAAGREPAYPSRNPWFSGDVDDSQRARMISLVNTSERAAKATACYSSGSSYSDPRQNRVPELAPVCSIKIEIHIPPFGSEEVAIGREGNTHFDLTTKGEAIVLRMLQPLDPRVKLYKVDSTIKFGEEAPPTSHR